VESEEACKGFKGEVRDGRKVKKEGILKEVKKKLSNNLV